LDVRKILAVKGIFQVYGTFASFVGFYPTLTCEKPCRLCGEAFMEGEEIEVTFPASVDLEGCQSSGRWEPGGYSSRWIRDHALEIIESSRNRIIFNVQK
jgi:hypothetical protein